MGDTVSFDKVLIPNKTKKNWGLPYGQKGGRHMFWQNAELFQEALEIQELYTKMFSRC